MCYTCYIRFYSCALRVVFVHVISTILSFSRESKNSKRKSKLKDKLVPRYNTVQLIFPGGFNGFVEFLCNTVIYVYFVRRHCRPRNNVLTSPVNWKSWANVWRKPAAPLPLKSSWTKNAKPRWANFVVTWRKLTFNTKLLWPIYARSTTTPLSRWATKSTSWTNSKPSKSRNRPGKPDISSLFTLYTQFLLFNYQSRKLNFELQIIA